MANKSTSNLPHFVIPLLEYQELVKAVVIRWRHGELTDDELLLEIQLIAHDVFSEVNNETNYRTFND